MGRATILEQYCKGCGLCVVACKKDALRMADQVNAKDVRAAEVAEKGTCTLCGRCYLMCPDCAIVLEKDDP